MTASVVRPLTAALGTPAKPGKDGTPASEAQLAEALHKLALEATRLRVRAPAATSLREASAALQDLACQAVAGDGERLEARRTELGALLAGLPPMIQSAEDGPYLLTNINGLTDWLGVAVDCTPQAALCRCGASEVKPWCDGSHAQIGFHAVKADDRVPDQLEQYHGIRITIADNRGTCAHSGFCTDRLPSVFRTDQEPFVAPTGGRVDEIIRAGRDCPSGALSATTDGEDPVGRSDQQRPPAIEVSRDGPYRVTGNLTLLDSDGRPEPRNEGASLEHYSLCRCGKSQNKPFCSGMHWYVEFRDPPVVEDRTPTMFEWCGGLPALTRMTRIFYEKHVPEDPMLAPLFANMSADHPQRVAKWLAEVFGGPPCYSEEYGGYPRMLSQHIGKGLTDEWRSRWVALLMQSAQEAGLPNDAEFRSAFQAYIEWGSRLAVENSQSGAQPPEHMPMPHWDWTTAAGPPGGRISALAPETEVAAEPIVLPAPDEPVRYEKHIRQLFGERDRKSMSFAFDLWSYADVQSHAEEILERVGNGSMPCDAAWSEEWVATFARWVQSGRAA
ncbi:MAG TPA: CDGSH iron-sulfur domain-containing protein [Solirubrobacteraceae bacterium]